MDKLNLYTALNIDKYYWGGAIEVNTPNVNEISDITKLLDQICIDEGLTPLGERWNKIDYDEFKEMLQSALQFNLGYINHENMTLNKAMEYYSVLTDKLNIKECNCFTNWFSNPWKSKNGSSFNSVSVNTLDMVLSIFDKNKLLFIYILFED